MIAKKTRQPARTLLSRAVGAALILASASAAAQGSGSTSSGSGSGSTASGSGSGSASSGSAPAFGGNDPSPYYIGASQSLTHDSNVYRIPSGPSDNYSSTSLLGGFDQPISRQRVFGRANVTVNRYQNEDRLNNVSYDLTAGLAWETIEKLSGNLNVALGRNLAAPAASAGVPGARRNIAQTESVDARARWGGASTLTLEGGLGYSRLDYSAPEYVASESRQTSASLGLYYRPGGLLRLGIAGRATRTKTPMALFDPATATYQSNTLRGNNLDLLADYELTGLLSASGRLSYTRQTNSGVDDADFSGITGGINLNWRVTGKTSLRLDAAREAGFDIARYNGTTAIVNNGTLVLAPISMAYENNRVTNTVGLGATYAATAKINANAGLRYSRAKLVATAVNAGGNAAAPESTDVLKSASIGANYAYSRAVSGNCNLSHEKRDVSGGVTYSYSANTVGCSVQFTLR